MTTVYSKSPSKNRKIAKLDAFGVPQWPYVFATYREVGPTCPLRCGFHPAHDTDETARIQGKTCYARVGRTALHARRATRDERDGDLLFRWIQGLPDGCGVRLHVSGDVYNAGEFDAAYFARLCEAFASRPTVTGWLYTHVPFVEFVRMRDEAPANLAVNWSCDTFDEAQQKQAEGVTGLTCVLSLDEARTRIKGVTVCPQQTSGISCAECQLCWKGDRKAIIGFIAH